jgi:hypothetical protein
VFLVVDTFDVIFHDILTSAQAIVAWCEDGPAEVCGGAVLGLGTPLLISISAQLLYSRRFNSSSQYFHLIHDAYLRFSGDSAETQTYKGMEITYSGCDLPASLALALFETVFSPLLSCVSYNLKGIINAYHVSKFFAY